MPPGTSRRMSVNEQGSWNKSSVFVTMSKQAPSGNDTVPLCYSINNPPFHYNHTIASVYYSTILSGLGLSSNLFAFVVLIKTFLRTKSLSRSSFLIFLAGLVVTDFMGLLVTGSIVISFHATHFVWREVDPYCHFCNFMGMSMVFYGLCPLLLGAAMAIERFVGINRPFARSTSMSKGRALTTVMAVWVMAGVISLLPLTGLGSYHMQKPGSWCFFNISSRPLDLSFSLIFSLLGLLSLAVSFVLNTVSLVTLLRVFCGQDATVRRRDHELEMMAQLIGIMSIASICWCPLLIFVLRTALSGEVVSPDFLLFFLRLATCNQICDPWIYILCQKFWLRRVFIVTTVLSGKPLVVSSLLLWLRFATFNQILDPWIYILFRRAVLKRVYPKLDWPRGSIASLYPSFTTSLRKLTRSSLGGGLDEGPPQERDAPCPLQPLSS